MGPGEVFEDLAERMIAGCPDFATGQSCRVGDSFVKGCKTQLSPLSGGVHVTGFRFGVVCNQSSSVANFNRRYQAVGARFGWGFSQGLS